MVEPQSVGQEISRRRVLGAGALGVTALALPAASTSASGGGPSVDASGYGGEWIEVPHWSSLPGTYGNVLVSNQGSNARSGMGGWEFQEGGGEFEEPDHSFAALSFSPDVQHFRVQVLFNGDDLDYDEIFSFTFRRDSLVIGYATIVDNVGLVDGYRTFAPAGGFDRVSISFSNPGRGASGLRLFIPNNL